VSLALRYVSADGALIALLSVCCLDRVPVGPVSSTIEGVGGGAPRRSMSLRSRSLSLSDSFQEADRFSVETGLMRGARRDSGGTLTSQSI